MSTVSSIATKRRRRVLVIDDEPAMTEWLRIVIEAEGYEVRSALIGARGEEIFRQWRPDVVLTDLELPDTDGIGLLRRLKEVDESPQVIVVGAQGGVARAVEAGQAGVRPREQLGQRGAVDSGRGRERATAELGTPYRLVEPLTEQRETVCACIHHVQCRHVNRA